MQVKLVYGNKESDWIDVTKKLHRQLQQNRPSEVVVHIEDFYPGSPDAGQIVSLSFEVFNALAREFVLEENRQMKQIQRHCDIRPIESINPQEYSLQLCDPDEELIRQELRMNLDTAMSSLTATQRRRFNEQIIDKKSLNQIAVEEGVLVNAIDCSIRTAKKKIKKGLKCACKNRCFLSD